MKSNEVFSFYNVAGIVLMLLMQTCDSAVIQFLAGTAIFGIYMLRMVIDAISEPYARRYL